MEEMTKASTASRASVQCGSSDKMESILRCLCPGAGIGGSWRGLWLGLMIPWLRCTRGEFCVVGGWYGGAGQRFWRERMAFQ